ncbi:hypothetical protein A3715_11775 [Oleiphilus sp. HI0009]|nr:MULTISPECIES: FliH/SctL family protein [unclassified Oleiphilus]KZX76973.1 hypothetical protein A3715_11775 [Oleiphilus sp. HI0009]KZY66132.1 hypothetical protein A3738_07160 [Oleiphilus sp. HI0066]KZY77447.1 hypothetical protein A3739_00015 [Oleiphilus sp. HI0067]
MSEQNPPKDDRPVESLSAYERWELPNLNSGEDYTDSAKVKPLTADDLEAIRAEAYAEGLKQGKADGYNAGVEEGRTVGIEQSKQEGLEQGRQQADSELQSHKQALSDQLKALLDPIESQRDQLEDALLNTILAVVRAVIHTEIKQSTDVIRLALQNAINSLPKRAREFSISLNPQDIPIVQPLIEEIDKEVAVVPSPHLARGGCLVETSQQVVDYTIEKRFQHAVQSMLLQAAKSQNFEVHQESPATLESHVDFASEVLEDAPDQDISQDENGLNPDG